MSLGYRIRLVREAMGLTQEKLAEITGFARQTISAWENDKFPPDTNNLKTLASDLGVSASYLLDGDEDISDSIEKDTIYVPIITNDIKACCGEGNNYPDDIEWEIKERHPMNPKDVLGYSWQTGNRFYIIRAEGRSMEPIIYEGQRILFAPCPDVRPVSGDIAILKWMGRVMIRGIAFSDKTIILTPANKDGYDEIRIKAGDPNLFILGKVIGEVPGINPIRGMW